jgi:hypothetical protein
MKRPDPFYSLEEINNFSEKWTRLSFDEKKSHTELLNTCSIELGRAYWYEYQLTKYTLELESELKELKKEGEMPFNPESFGFLPVAYKEKPEIKHFILERGVMNLYLIPYPKNIWDLQMRYNDELKGIENIMINSILFTALIIPSQSFARDLFRNLGIIE